jgi:hypothetical protein
VRCSLGPSCSSVVASSASRGCEELKRLAVQTCECDQIKRVDAALSALALRDERLRLAEAIRRLDLGQAGGLPCLAQPCGKGAVGITAFRLRAHAPEDILG